MSEQEQIQRNVLPIPDRPRTGLVLYDAKDPENKYPPIIQLRPPKGAPNVMIILIDDAGFGSSSAFGGPCATPKSCRPRWRLRRPCAATARGRHRCRQTPDRGRVRPSPRSPRPRPRCPRRPRPGVGPPNAPTPETSVTTCSTLNASTSLVHPHSLRRLVAVGAERGRHRLPTA